MNRVPRWIENLLILLGLCMMMSATAAPLVQTTAAGGGITLKDLAYGAIGLAVALIGLWSKRQDKDIAEANVTAARALAEAHRIELMVVQIRAQLTAEERFREP